MLQLVQTRSALPVRRWPERRPVVLSAAVLLFVALFVLRMSTNDVNTGIGLLFVIPTGLVALELGMVAGLVAAGLASALIIIWSTTSGAHLGVTGDITRSFVFFAVAAVGGRFSDRMRGWALRQRKLLDSGLELAHLAGAAELPRIVAAQVRAAVDAAGVRVTLADGGGAVDGAVHDDPVTVPIELRGEWLGEIEIELARPLVPEDQATLATLALQAAVAIENVRLLIEGHERTDQLREVLSGQEDERRHVAQRLHEGSAQEVAGLLLGLRAIERSLESEAARPQLDELREHAQSTLEGLRELAVMLRPPVLDLGLEEALKRLGQRRSAQLTITLDGAVGRLSRDDETTVYRVVEDALDAFDHPGDAVVEANAGELVVSVGGADGEAPRTERVKTIGARLELLGGSLSTNGELRVRIPLS